MRLLLYPHGGSRNHGCEAIVRSTAKLTGADLVLASSTPEEDRTYGLDACCNLIKDKRPLVKSSFRFLWSSFRRHVLGDKDALDKLVFKPLFDAADGCDIALSIGGDNYCYGDNQFLYLIDRELRRRKIKNVLWGCSIEPGSLAGTLLEDLKGFDRIVARESLTYEALKSEGFENIDLFPDPAFVLERKETTLPEGFVEGNMVGINVSPLIMSYEKRSGGVLENMVRLIQYILRESDMGIALIPHVVRKGEDDRAPLGLLYERFKDSGRVVMVEDRPAEQLKDIIARCRFMVAARTHACIAAYSTGVPALAVGYSVKSRGIARDIMPAGQEFVVPVGSLSGPDLITEAFGDLVRKEVDVRTHLQNFIPEYVGRLGSLNL